MQEGREIKHINRLRPLKAAVFLSIAHSIKHLSHDAETQVGAVIVNANNKVVGMGYNGWIHDIDDSILPNVRPHKYPYMIHAELNAIFNTFVSFPLTDCTLYCTGHPCYQCLQYIWQVGIRHIIYDKNVDIKCLGDNKKETQTLLDIMGQRMKITPYDFQGVSHV
jgi:dCMP deaminase